MIEYIEASAKGKCGIIKWGRILSLMNLAKVNDRLTDVQVEHLIKSYYRE